MGTVLDTPTNVHRDTVHGGLVRQLWAHPLGRVFARGDRMLTVLEPTITFAGRVPIGKIPLERLRRLRAESILSVRDVKVWSGGRVVVETDLAEATTLARLLASGPVPPDRAVNILRKVALALADAHRVGLTHGALSTASVLVGARGGRDDAVWVADFGLGALSWARHEGSAATVPCSPERTLGLARGPAEDVYLFGCVAFAALSGSAVFDGEAADTVRRRHAIEDAPNLRHTEGGRDVPAPLAAFVASCLAKEPEDRFADAGALEAALREAQRASGIATPWDEASSPRIAVPLDTTPTSKRRAPARRWRLVWVLLIVALGGGWFFARGGEASRESPTIVADEPEPTLHMPAIVPFVEHADRAYGRSSGGGEPSSSPSSAAAGEDGPRRRTARRSRAKHDRSRKKGVATREIVDGLLGAAKAAGNRGDAVEAERLLQKALAHDGHRRATLEALGKLRFDRGDFRGVVEVLARAVARAPGDADLWIRLGDAHFKLQAYEEARRCFAKAKALGHPAADRRLVRTGERGG